MEVPQGFDYGYSIFGDGSDGDVVISSNTTLTRTMYYNTLTIESGYWLCPDGYIIFVKDLLVVEGTIQSNGHDASGFNGGSAYTSHILGGSGAGGDGANDGTYGGGGGGAGGGVVMIVSKRVEIKSGGKIQANGGNGADYTGTIATPTDGKDGYNSPTEGKGGNGGSGGDSYSGVGGSGGTVTLHDLEKWMLWCPFPYLSLGKFSGGAGGGGGACDDTEAGGGGGGGGGFVLIITQDINNSGTIEANGGSGGLGSMEDYMGTNGNDGTVWLIEI